MTPTPLPLDAYYDSARKCYLVRDDKGCWMSIEKADVKMRLQAARLSVRKHDTDLISQVDAAVLRIQNERHVAYAGPLAGYTCGVHNINGSDILVTQSPKVIESKPGDWSILRQLWDNPLAPLPTDTVDQRILLYSWIKLADEQFRKCLATGTCTYGQFLILTGPRGAAKSLTQLIITEILGGRSAAPYGYMSGATPFNRELFCAEHQMIEDEQPHKDYKSRVRFGEAIKQIAATLKRPCYGKNRDGQSLTPFWRGTLSVNDEPDHLGVLPPFEESLIDKIILLHFTKHPMPMPAATADEKEAFWKQLVSELPAFLHWLRNEFVIPLEYRDLDGNRYGLRHFIHPYIISLIDDMAPETQLLSFADHILFNATTTVPWTGTAEELTRVLSDHIHYGPQARRFLGSGSWCGRHLAKLAASKPERVTGDRSTGLRNWVIRPPKVLPNTPTATILSVADESA